MSATANRSTVSEGSIARLAMALGAEGVGGPLSKAEVTLVAEAGALATPPPEYVRAIWSDIRQGNDPLGELFYSLRDADERRSSGSVYTPAEIVDPMVAWVVAQSPSRVVDAGAGSGRFTAAVLRANVNLAVMAVDLDPLATLMTRAAVAVLGGTNVTVLQADFTKLRLLSVEGPTAFIGNPPYVRHHELSPKTKAWAQLAAASVGHKVSGLAGLHAYFYLAVATLARPGDIGCFVTSGEWLDVNYGAIIRCLLVDQLGGEEVHVVEPEATPFDGTATTAAVVQFRIGTPKTGIGFRTVSNLPQLSPLIASASPVARERLNEATR